MTYRCDHVLPSYVGFCHLFVQFSSGGAAAKFKREGRSPELTHNNVASRRARESVMKGNFILGDLETLTFREVFKRHWI